MITDLVIGQFSNGFDVHVWVGDESFQFRELWSIVVSDKLHPAREDPIRNRHTEDGITTLCTTRISLSTSTERLFAWTMTLYSGLECTGMDIASLDDGLA